MTQLAERPALADSSPPARYRAAIYTRISEDRSGEAEGVERQREACEKLAAFRDLDVVGYFEDNDRSAMHSADNRPRRRELLDAVRRGEIDVILVLRTDRLYRQLKELVELTAVLGNVPVYSVKSGDVDLSNADGRLRANIMGAVAQHESEVKGERVSDAAEQRARKGRFNGGQRRFGYRHDETQTITIPTSRGVVIRHPLVLVPEEADAIRWAYDEILTKRSLESVVREWRARGLTGPQGARFTGVVVREILLRPMNAGLAFYKGSEVGVTDEQLIPRIIDDADKWRTVRAILTDPARRTTVGRPPVSLLAPVLRCAVCLSDPPRHGTGGMSAKFRQRGNGTRDLIYICREAGHVSRTRHKLDAAIEELIVAYLVRNASALRRPASKTTGTVSKAMQDAEKLRDKLTGYHARAADMDPADYANATKAVRAKLAEVEKRIVVSSGNPATSALVRADDIPTAWAALTTDEKRTVIKENVDRIEIGRGTSGARDKTMHNVRVIGRDGTELTTK